MPVSKNRQFAKIANDVNTSGTLTAAALSSDVSLGATVYDSVGLLPTSGVNAGDQAFVTSTSRLYINSGVGWYNVAVINATPVITSITDSDGLSGPFALSTEGLDTTITIVATDSDTTDTITYSATADSSFNGLATVSQSGDTFTISPFGQDSATSFSGTLTFKATDGINIANSIQTFTISFLSQYWDELSLGIGISSTSLDNSSFIDRSSNAFTQTAVNSPQHYSFNPYLDNYSVDTVNGGQLRSNYSGALGTSDFSLETWIYWNSGTAYGWTGNRPLNGSGALGARLTSTSISIGLSSSSLYNEVMNATGIPDLTSRWAHVVICRSSGTTSIFVDGVRYATSTTSYNWNSTSAPWAIGMEYGDYNSNSTNDIKFFDYRLVVGSSAYDATQTTLTVPTEKLTSITNTQILACRSNRFIDESGNSVTLTPLTSNTGPQISAFNPFGQGSEYSNNGSVFFDETQSQYIISDLTTTSGVDDTWTIEAWSYPTTDGTPEYLFGFNNKSTGANDYIFSQTTNYWKGASFGGVDAYWLDGQWNHVAIASDGTNIRYFINGVQRATTTYSASFPLSNCVAAIGVEFDGANGGSPGNYMDGWVADWSISDTCKYTTDFTPPTSRQSADADVLYVPFDNAGIYDKTGNPNLITVSSGTGGTPSVNTTYTKYAAASIYFPGGGSRTSGPHLRLPSKFASFGATNWTHEFWMYVDSLPSSVNQGIAGNNNANNYMSEFRLVLRTDGKLDFNAAHSSGSYDYADITTSTAISAQTWTHVAVVRNGASINVYIDGTNSGGAGLGSATAVLGRNGAATPFLIGKHCDDMLAWDNTEAYFNGYIENYQIFQNFAKYTGNFTVPTSTQGRSYQAES